MPPLGPISLEDLRRSIGDRLVTTRTVIEAHGRDESPLPPAFPDAVAYVGSTAEVAEIVKVCARHRIPIVPFGAGTSLEGHVLATSGGVSLDMTGMDAVLDVRVDDLDVTVEAGVTRRALEERLTKEGLFFPVDPGADATLGGMAATGASGTTTVRYGAMRENVLSLKVVLADGSVIDTAHRARKSSAGYDLTRLMIGSEGTLGVITELTLRTYGIPEQIAAAMCHFPDVHRAIETVIRTLQVGVPVARIEFLDEQALKGINDYSGSNHPLAPTLMLEFHGSETSVTEQVESVGAIAREYGVLSYRSAIGGQERAELWRARHDSFYATLSLRPGAKAVTTDVCVPISRLAECITATRADVDELSLFATMVGHVGDGNFHVQILIDPDASAEMAAAELLNERLVARALSMDGTCSGEHGIGLRKMGSLVQELPGAVEVMRSIKRTLDPLNIMNPGKVLSL